MPFLAETFLQKIFAPIEKMFGKLESALEPSAGLAESLGDFDAWIWGLFLIFLLVGTGLFIAWRTRFIQLRKLGHAISLVSGRYDNPKDAGEITHFQALATALSATIGTGNIAGVATAIATGGPGAVFWMWVTGLLGSGLKFASCTLGMRFRVINPDGSASGGPMYYLEHGLGRRWFPSLVKLSALIGGFFLSKYLTGLIAATAIYQGIGAPPLFKWWLLLGLLLAAILFVFYKLGLVIEERSEGLVSDLDPWLTRVRFDKWLAVMFALFAAIASFGIGNMIQANSMALPLNEEFGLPKSLVGLVVAILVGMVIIGGIKRIGNLTAKLTPIMTVIYVVGALVILAKNAQMIPDAFRLIFTHAFSPTSAAGGFAGSAVALTIRQGVARGVFSNEGGLGSAPIAHAAAKTKEPVREGLVAMIGPFVDTLLICTLTALVIICTGAWRYIDPATGMQLDSTLLSKYAFGLGIPGGEWIVTIGIILFTFSTIVGWSYYGDRSVGYLFGNRGISIYRWIYIILIPLGAAMKVELMWTISDITNGMMAFPNLVALIFLSPMVVEMARDYFSREHKPYR